MLTSLKKYSTIISLLLILLLLIVAWIYPSIGLMVGIALLGLALVMACIAVIQKHRRAYLQGKISYLIFLRNVALEIAGILSAAAAAAFLGNWIALLATHSINDTLIRFAAGVLVGLIIGIAIGTLVRKLWNRLLLVVRLKSKST